MASAARPVICLTLGSPATLADVQKWCALADLLGMEEDMPVELSAVTGLSVTGYLSDLPYPQEASGD